MEEIGIKKVDIFENSNNLKKIAKPLNCLIELFLIYKNFLNCYKKITIIFLYWILSLVPKKKNLWIFTGFYNKCYIDNTKYLYEFISKNHPEIRAIWITKNKRIYNYLKSKNLKVLKTNRIYTIYVLSRASLVFTDHYKSSDYNLYGYNARTKVVNLWHGVGLKNMTPRGEKIPNTTIKGVRLSSDILCNPEDSFAIKIKKIYKYILVAPFRELFEKYYLIICPGKQFIQYNAKPWKIPSSAYFLCGYPRTEKLYNSKNRGKYSILYAPTYRWAESAELNLVKYLIESLDKINKLLIDIDGNFIFRLHPHTWRNYKSILNKKIVEYSRISLSLEEDVYENLGNYSILVTDYSSIAYDFLLTRKPIVYLPFDITSYINSDNTFSMSYSDNCAGAIASSWEDAIEEIRKYFDNPSKDKNIRENILNIFSPLEINNINNSERIILELKSRLKI